MPMGAAVAVDALFAKLYNNPRNSLSRQRLPRALAGRGLAVPMRAEVAVNALFAKLRDNPRNSLPHQGLPLALAGRGTAMPMRAEVAVDARFAKLCDNPGNSLPPVGVDTMEPDTGRKLAERAARSAVGSAEVERPSQAAIFEKRRRYPTQRSVATRRCIAGATGDAGGTPSPASLRDATPGSSARGMPWSTFRGPRQCAGEVKKVPDTILASAPAAGRCPS